MPRKEGKGSWKCNSCPKGHNTMAEREKCRKMAEDKKSKKEPKKKNKDKNRPKKN